MLFWSCPARFFKDGAVLQSQFKTVNKNRKAGRSEISSEKRGKFSSIRFVNRVSATEADPWGEGPLGLNADRLQSVMMFDS